MFEVPQVKVHIWDHKCALSLDVPKTWFNNWPDDDFLSRNMSPLSLTIN